LAAIRQKRVDEIRERRALERKEERRLKDGKNAEETQKIAREAEEEAKGEAR